MRFNLIDRVESVSPQRLVGVKYVSLAEEYLADHFPTFPVLPGVLMLEALTQAATWVLHQRHDFQCSIAVLKEARNVKYGSFVPPGKHLRVEVTLTKEVDGVASFTANGTVEQANGTSSPGSSTQAVSARLQIAYFNLARQVPALADIDRRLVEHARQRWALIAPATAAGVSIATAGAVSL